MSNFKDDTKKVVSLAKFREERIVAELDSLNESVPETQNSAFLNDSDIISLIRVLIYLRSIGNSAAKIELIEDMLAIEIKSFESFDNDSSINSGERYIIHANTSISDDNGELLCNDDLLQCVKEMILRVDIDFIDGDIQ